MSISLAFALVMSMVFVPMLVSACKLISQSGGTTIEIVQGRAFLIRFTLEWDEPDWAGWYDIFFYWDCYENHSHENFTFENASAYFVTGDHAGENLMCIADFYEGPLGTGTRYSLYINDRTETEFRDGEFNVDIWLRASGTGDVPHVPTDNHPICGVEMNYGESWGYHLYPSDITVRVFPAIEVEISPSSQEGTPGSALEYAVAVSNVGETTYSFALAASDNAGWNPTLSENPLENVGPGENRIVILSATVPDNATSFDEDNIWVTATSVEYAWVSDNASCVARVQGRAEFALDNLYNLSLDADLYLGGGSKLVLKFYTYADVYQDENVVWSGSTPDNVSFSKFVPHPKGSKVPVENVRLVLVDGAGAEIATLGTFTVTRSILLARLSRIKSVWPLWLPPPLRSGLIQEISAITSQWPFAPEGNGRIIPL